MNIYKDKIINYLIFFFLIYFCVSYFFKLEYVLSTRDEISYLSDSLLLLEGITPVHSYAPAGISTWFGSLFVLIDFLINKISLTSTEKIFDSFDANLFKHYQNLIYIKSSLFFLNSILLIYFFFLDKKKIFLLLLFIFLLLPQINLETFSGTPYFTACIFCAISFTLKDKNKLLSLIFFGLALSERIEFILLINFVILDYNKIKLKNYFIIFITFMVASPWFSITFLANIKTIVSVFYNMSGNNTEPTLVILLTKISLILFIVIIFIYSFSDNKKIKTFYLLLLSLMTVNFYFSGTVGMRWLLPVFLVLSYEISLLINKNLFINKTKDVPKILLVITALSLLLVFNNKNFISDDQILEKETNSNKKILIGSPLLKEKLNYYDYQMSFGNYLNTHNINNINFFKNQNAPLAFGITGNLANKHNRRYQFLNKYGSKDFPMKYLHGNSGLHWSIKDFCKILDEKDISIISYPTYSLSSCEDIN